MPRCAVCGQDNPGGFRFCGACGASLTGPARPPAEERRLVTVLFCDLVGFTARSDQADPEDVGALLRPYHIRLRAEIERLGGTLDKFVGDGVMAVFGAPVAHEDDPERAVRCALGMLAASEELNLMVRIGITTGEALVRFGPARQTEGVVGDVVNTASRLQGVAPAGGVVVGEATFRATRRLFDYQDLGPVQVKGKADPVPVWRLEGGRGRTGVDAGPAAPLVGRQAELRLLEDAYRRTAAAGTARLVTVAGAPGIGKSRLVRELAALLDALPELVTWRQGRCLPYGDGITFWALGEIVKAQAGVLESDDPATVAAKLEAAVAGLAADPADREWLKARIAPLLGLVDPETARVERSESFTAWRRFVEAMAGGHPLVLVVEDLHWADPAMLEFVEHLCTQAAGTGLLVVATTRPELFERHPGWGEGIAGAATVTLPPLTEAETGRLVAGLLGQAVLPSEVQAPLLERAGGNPLYAEEFVRLLTDRGLLVRSGRMVRLAATAAIPFPDSVQALIAARLDMLPAAGKALVQDAAVAGRVFWPGSLAALAGTAEEAVRAGLAELEAKELIHPVEPSTVEGQTEFAFSHGLVRDVAYAQIPRAGRARRHRAVAAWLEGLAGARVADLAEVIAHHYAEALALTGAAGGAEAELAALREPARRALVLAGDRALTLDLARAQAFYGQALELFPAGHPERLELLLRLGRVVFQEGRMAESRQAYEEALAGFAAAGDPVGQGGALNRLSTVLWNQGETARSREVLAKAIELLEPAGPGPALGDAYAHLAFDRLMSGEAELGRVWAERALELARRLELPDLEVRALDARGLARTDLGDPGGLDDLRAALAVGLESGASLDAAVIYGNLAEPLWSAEGPASALANCRQGVDFAERRGLTEITIWVHTSSLGPLFDLGRWDEVLERADEVIARDKAHGGRYVSVIAEAFKGQVLVWRGRLAAAETVVQELLPQARKIDDLQVLVPALVTAALLGKAAGREAEALRLAAEADRVTRERNGGRWYRGQHLADLARIAAPNGARQLAEALARDHQVYARHRLGARTARALLAEADGDLEGAARLYDQAADGWARYGHLGERGQGLLGAGRCLRRLGHPGAAARLQAAREVFERLGAGPLVREAGAELREAAGA
jgi:class 3 adenylate cyclase/tetratricopeptide (TPR) repeat protein/type II secretory pathway predicted ATPase ExeA